LPSFPLAGRTLCWKCEQRAGRDHRRLASFRIVSHEADIQRETAGNGCQWPTNWQLGGEADPRVIQFALRYEF
jgi:hypothetical protein